MLRQRGVTLVEVVVALLLFTLGALGVAASSAALARQLGENDTRLRAAHAARSRAEISAAGGCAMLASGSWYDPPISSEWTVAHGRVVTLDQRISRATARGMQADSFHSATRCD